jgi:hypothetical protein
MTRLTTKLMIAAAALVAAGAASAQTMQANIPFAFRANGRLMAAGKYYVDLPGSGHALTIRSKRGGVLAMPMSSTAGAESNAKLVFECRRAACSLAEVWPGNSHDGLVFATPKRSRDEEASRTVIPLRTNTDE